MLWIVDSDEELNGLTDWLESPRIVILHENSSRTTAYWIGV